MIFTVLSAVGKGRNKEKMTSYICCKRGGNNCPKKEECRRYINADIGVAWNLFKYMCTEENDYHLFMEKEETTEVVLINKEQNASKDTKNEGSDNTNE